MPEPKTKVIDEMEFQLAQPYVAGHVVSEAEAKVLNQVRSENIGNNLRETVKAAKKKAEAGDRTDLDNLVALVADYDAKYTFALGGGGFTRRDPVEKEAYAIAKEFVKNKLNQQGRKLTDVPEGHTEETWKAKLEESYDKVAGSEEVLKMAKKRVAEKKKAADAAVADLDL